MNIILEEAGGHRSIDENRRYLLTLYSSYCVKMEKKEKKKTIEVNALQSRKIAISVYLSISPRTHRRRRPRHLAAEFKESEKEKKEKKERKRGDKLQLSPMRQPCGNIQARYGVFEPRLGNVSI